MTPKSIKLHYFDAPGRAEATRAILHWGNVQYEDIRYKYEEWHDKKSMFPFHQVPVLEVDCGNGGVMIPQSSAIMIYAAKLANLYPSNPLEAALADAVVAAAHGTICDLNGLWFHKPEPMKAEIGKRLAEKDIPELLCHLDKWLEKVGGKEFILPQVCYADIALCRITCGLQKGHFGFMPQGIPDFEKRYPTLAKLCCNLKAHPQAKECCKKEECLKKD